MDAIFERNLDQVSLVLKDSSAGKSDGFETKMACVGGVPGLLPMSVRQMNGETAYVYDVTARQPLSGYLKGRSLSALELAEILKTVLSILEGLETYLLDADHLLFSAEKIFAQGGFRELWLCYVPSHRRPIREGLYGLTMELLSNVDQKDRDAIVLGYRFAHALQEENTSFGDLRACLCGKYKEAEAFSEFSEENTRSEVFDFAKKKPFGAFEGITPSDPGGYAPGIARNDPGGFAQGTVWNDSGSSVQGIMRNDPDGFEQGNARNDIGGFAQEITRNDFNGFAQGIRRNDPDGFAQIGAGKLCDSPGSGISQGSPGEVQTERADRIGWKEYEEESFHNASADKKRKKISLQGLNRRTILIVVIGGAVLFAAYLFMHPEVAEKLLAGLQANPLLAGGTLLAIAAAAGVFLFVKKRAVAGEARATAASSWALDESAWTAAKTDSGNPFDNPLRTASSARTDSAISTLKSAFAGQGSKGLAGTAFAGQGNYCFAGTTSTEPVSNGLAGTAFARTRSFDESVLTTCILAPVKKEIAAKLRPEGKAEAFGEILLQKSDTILGKQVDLVDIVIPSPVISRIHARISRQGEAWYLTDLNSRNGTAVNNTLLESMKEEKIENGDSLRFANLEYVFEIKSQSKI